MTAVFDAGFLDVAANALAIMIFVTMFALLTVRSEPTVLHDPRFDRELPLTLRVQPPLAERPFLDYYLVFDGMIVRWEQGRYVEHLIEHGLRKTVRADGGKLRVSARMEPRDPDSYTASFVPDFEALAGRARRCWRRNRSMRSPRRFAIGRRHSAGCQTSWSIPPE